MWVAWRWDCGVRIDLCGEVQKLSSGRPSECCCGGVGGGGGRKRVATGCEKGVMMLKCAVTTHYQSSPIFSNVLMHLARSEINQGLVINLFDLGCYPMSVLNLYFEGVELVCLARTWLGLLVDEEGKNGSVASKHKMVVG
ncbi:hypothetical protein Tco_0238167 [Tanacetum coccineum]